MVCRLELISMVCSRTRVAAMLFFSFGVRSERNRDLNETGWLVDQYGKGQKMKGGTWERG